MSKNKWDMDESGKNGFTDDSDFESEGDSMPDKDYLESFKDGIGFVGKMAAKSAVKLHKQLKGDDKYQLIRATGLFYQRHVQPFFGDMVPRFEYYESVTKNRLKAGFVKKFIRSSADRAFTKACYSILFGNFDEAVKILKEASVSDPQYTDVYFLLGSIYLMKNEYAKAAENFGKCRLLPTGLDKNLKKFMPTLKLSLCITENLSFHFYADLLGLSLLYAISLRNAGKLREAIISLEQILSVMPDNPEIIFFLSIFYFEAQWDDKLIEMLTDMLPDEALQILCIQFLVRTWIEKKNYNLAEGILQKALEAEDNDPHLLADVRMLLGLSAKKRGRSAEGSAYSSKVKKQYPEYRNLIGRLGIIRGSDPLPKEAANVPGSRGIVPPAPLPSSMTVKISHDPSQLGIEGVEPGTVMLKSRCGRVNMPLPESLTIGREEGDLVLSWDGSSSRKHARIYHDRGQVWVEDVGSTNGTWINQHKIADKRVFNRGDNLLVGSTEFYLE